MKSPIRLLAKLINRGLVPAGIRIVKVRSSAAVLLPKWASALAVPPEHPLPQILESYPNYQSNLARLVKLISIEHPEAGIVDVGANIGDTAALIRSVCNLPLICIEPDEVFFSYLQSNTAQMTQVVRIQRFLADVCSEGVRTYKSYRCNGTMHLVLGDSESLNFITFDELQQSKFPSVRIKLIKIDTDGFDIKVLRGALQTVVRDKPVLYFEYDPTILIEKDPRYIETLKDVVQLGFNYMVVFDHLGKLLWWSKDSVIGVLKPLDQYLRGKQGLLPYVDICLMSEEDERIYKKLIEPESCSVELQ